MDSLWFHPKLVHLPIALGILMPMIAGGLAVAWWRGWLPARTWIIAIVLQAVLALSAVIALRTGEAEEDRVERVVAKSHIHDHEEAAEAFTWTAGAVLLPMALALILSRGKIGKPMAALATVGTVVVLFLGYKTGEAGGALVYQHGAANAYTEPSSATTSE